MRHITVVLAALACLMIVAPLARARARPHRGIARPGARHHRAQRRPKPTFGPHVTVTLTTQHLTRALTPMPSLRFSSAPVGATRTLHVSSATRYQTITGFGAAMTDSSAWLLYDELTPLQRAAAMNALFGPRGIALNFVRVPIGASDFSATGVPYSYDDLPPGQTDPALAHFSIAHDLPYVIPALREVLTIDPQARILAAPWSAPPWMKANDAFDDLGDRGTLLPSAYGTFAEYLVRFIQAYQAEGVPIAGITPENEPNAGSAFPAMALPGTNEGQLIASDLAPALSSAGLRTSIWGLDTGGGDTADAQALMASPAARLLAGLAWHCYGGDASITALHVRYPHLSEIVSECSPGIIPYAAAEAVIAATRNWSSSVALWNLALDPTGGPVQPENSGCTGCTGLLTVSEQTHAATRGIGFYQLGQFSRFVQPGAVRISSERWVADFPAVAARYGVTPGLDNVAFLNPNGQKVLVAFNNSGTRVRFAVAWRGRRITYALASRATVTFVWR